MTQFSDTHPVLPLRDIVVFPHMIVPLFVGREKSVRALEAVMESDRPILLAAQKDAAVDEPDAEGIHRTGVLANVLQLLKLPDGTVKVLVEGQSRVRITEFVDNDAHFEAAAEPLSELRAGRRHRADPRRQRGIREIRQDPQEPTRRSPPSARRASLRRWPIWSPDI